MSFTSNQIGGEYSHELTEKELAPHSHTTYLKAKGSIGWPSETVNSYGVMIDYSTSSYVIPNQQVNATLVSAFTATSKTGKGGMHNNVQPFIVTYFWQRIK